MLDSAYEKVSIQHIQTSIMRVSFTGMQSFSNHFFPHKMVEFFLFSFHPNTFSPFYPPKASEWVSFADCPYNHVPSVERCDYD